MDGTTLAAGKTALITALQARPGLAAVNVSRHIPVAAADLRNAAGDFDAVWLGDATGDDNVIILKSLPLEFDESWELDLAIQVLRPTSTGTQDIADARAVAILGEVLGTLATDPTLGLGATFLRFEVIPTGWRHIAGSLPKGVGFGSRFELRLHADARLALT